MSRHHYQSAEERDGYAREFEEALREEIFKKSPGYAEFVRNEEQRKRSHRLMLQATAQRLRRTQQKDKIIRHNSSKPRDIREFIENPQLLVIIKK